MVTSLAFEVHLDAPFDEAVERVSRALGEEGFGVLTKIDVRKTLQEKLGAYYRDYTILGACNPRLAYRALLTNPQAGLLLPCNVTVERDFDDKVCVRIADPQVMLELAGLTDEPELKDVAKEAHARLRDAAAALEKEEGNRSPGRGIRSRGHDPAPGAKPATEEAREPLVVLAERVEHRGDEGIRAV